MKQNIIHFLSICTIFLLFNENSIDAQVTIGSLADPARGALLDLNGGGTTAGAGSIKGALILSNVALSDTTKIPDLPGAFHGVPNEKRDVNPELAGTLIFNTTENHAEGLIPGIYVWTGRKWECLSGELPKD
ncbi:MAG: hypothetical protein LBR64_02110 [Dysgonamonadaceae bacterium]|jgi:hypothetical protein|nr:hypothetical protein [Dysgonamonadaceae bacterium]